MGSSEVVKRKTLCAREDTNPKPLRPKRSALPTKLASFAYPVVRSKGIAPLLTVPKTAVLSVELRARTHYNYIIMRIVFSEHAIERMTLREITELQVFATVKSPQEKQASYRDRTIYKRKFDNRTLEVVTKVEGKNMIIISAYMVK